MPNSIEKKLDEILAILRRGDAVSSLRRVKRFDESPYCKCPMRIGNRFDDCGNCTDCGNKRDMRVRG